jgi:hypothetical protein
MVVIPRNGNGMLERRISILQQLQLPIESLIREMGFLIFGK